LFVLIDRANRFAHVAVYGVEQNEGAKSVPNSLHKIPKGNVYLYYSLLPVLNVKHQSLPKFQKLLEFSGISHKISCLHLI